MVGWKDNPKAHCLVVLLVDLTANYSAEVLAETMVALKDVTMVGTMVELMADQLVETMVDR